MARDHISPRLAFPPVHVSLLRANDADRRDKPGMTNWWVRGARYFMLPEPVVSAGVLAGTLAAGAFFAGSVTAATSAVLVSLA